MKRTTLDHRRPTAAQIVCGTSFVLLWLGCVPLDDDAPIGGGSLDGSVGGEEFSVSSGSAEPGLDETYVVTLANTPEFTCTASSGLPADYLQIVIGDVEETSLFDADGTVFFNVFVDGVSVSEPADSGTVTIDEIDELGGVIEGSIDASGPTSSVSGSFSVEICR